MDQKPSYGDHLGKVRRSAQKSMTGTGGKTDHALKVSRRKSVPKKIEKPKKVEEKQEEQEEPKETKPEKKEETKLEKKEEEDKGEEKKYLSVGQVKNLPDSLKKNIIERKKKAAEGKPKEEGKKTEK